MAKLQQRRPENVQGNFYVDDTCIDCDTCRWMAPEVFYDIGDQSAVYHQPSDGQEELHALQALLSCPTASIGTVDKPKEIKAVQDSIPILVSENVYHCGYHAENSFGAASYLIVHPQGNILVDSPRFSPPLVKKIAAMGGVKYLYLTHRDDVADHQKFHEHFACDRILHRDEISSGTRDVEIQLIGYDAYSLSSDLTIIPVPGHTKGHTVLLYDNKFLFTGDHLAWSETLKHLYAFKYACWYSWPELKKSMKQLANYTFEWVLPGHGRRYHTDAATMKQEMQICLDWLNQN